MDGFIYDIITTTVDHKHWTEHAKGAALLVIYTLFQPLHSSYPLKRDNIISLRKLTGKGKLAKQKTFLDWDIHILSLRVFLPKDNQKGWATDILEALDSTKV